MKAANLRGEIQYLVLCWTILLIVFGVVALTRTGNLGEFGSFQFLLLAGLGLHVPRLLARQQDRIEALEVELLRLKIRSPFAYAEPMAIDE